MPFDLYPRQVELSEWLLDCIRAGENNAIPKSRGTGATYVCGGLSLWMWNFDEAAPSVTWGSRKEELVDRIGDPDSIFEKLRIMRRRLPAWMLPVGFIEDKHDNYKRLLNPATGGTITGEQGENMGRGGRSLWYIHDEAAHGNGLDKIDRAVLENTHCKTDISTPNGMGQPFERKVRKGSVRVFYMRWNSVPHRDEAWLEKKRGDYAHDPVGFRQEIMIDFAGTAVDSVIPPAWVESARAIELGRPDAARSAGLDVGLEHDLNVYIDRTGPTVERVEAWTGLDTTQTAQKAVPLAANRGVRILCFDPIGVGAGVAGEFANYTCPACQGPGCEECTEGIWTPPFETIGVNVGIVPTDRVWPNDKTSKEQFANLKAELWWTVRERLRKTHERVTRGVDHPDAECISLPADADELAAQLSWPTWFKNARGLIQLEKKDATKRRLGTSESYDYADSLVLAYADDVVGGAGDVLVAWL